MNVLFLTQHKQHYLDHCVQRAISIYVQNWLTFLLFSAIVTWGQQCWGRSEWRHFEVNWRIDRIFSLSILPTLCRNMKTILLSQSIFINFNFNLLMTLQHLVRCGRDYIWRQKAPCLSDTTINKNNLQFHHKNLWEMLTLVTGNVRVAAGVISCRELVSPFKYFSTRK